MAIEYKDLKTEMRNPESRDLDTMPVKEILNLFYRQDLAAAEAVKKEHKNISAAIDIIHRSLELNGRI
ncbi:MAG TPA: hypothetical protein PKL57_14725, partial [Candidatus Wallbacteria bacterium]|nr:hypothetical protein [Candidatus Wallbacteria bacterium]